MTNEQIKQCTGCLQEKSMSEFYPDRRKEGRYRPRCKSCEAALQKTRTTEQFRAYARNWRDKNPESARASDRRKREKRVDKYQPDPHKYAARRKVRDAINKGILFRPNTCNRCHAPCKPQAHHADYDRPLDVEWLCLKCHGLESRIPDAQRATAFVRALNLEPKSK